MNDSLPRCLLAARAAATAGWLLVASGLVWAAVAIGFGLQVVSPHCFFGGLAGGVPLLVAAGFLVRGGRWAAVITTVLSVLFATAAAALLFVTFMIVTAFSDSWDRMATPQRRAYVACVLFWLTLGFAVVLPCVWTAWRAARSINEAWRVAAERRNPRAMGFEVIVAPPPPPGPPSGSS